MFASKASEAQRHVREWKNPERVWRCHGGAILLETGEVLPFKACATCGAPEFVPGVTVIRVTVTWAALRGPQDVRQVQRGALLQCSVPEGALEGAHPSCSGTGQSAHHDILSQCGANKRPPRRHVTSPSACTCEVASRVTRLLPSVSPPRFASVQRPAEDTEGVASQSQRKTLHANRPP